MGSHIKYGFDKLLMDGLSYVCNDR